MTDRVYGLFYCYKSYKTKVSLDIKRNGGNIKANKSILRGGLVLEYEYLKYPRSVVILAEEIKRVVNDYDARRIGNEELSEILLWYAHKSADKLFRGNDYPYTIKKILGARRVKLLDTILEEQQPTLFRGVK